MKTKRSKYRLKSPSKSSTKKLSYIILLIFIIVIFLFFQGDQGFFTYLKLQQEKRRLLKQIELLKKEHEDLIHEIDLLTNNYRYIEKIAREQHQMGKKGEKIYIISSPKK